MRSSILGLVSAEGEHVVNELPMHPAMYGVIAMSLLLFGLFVTLAYRNLRTRQR